VSRHRPGRRRLGSTALDNRPEDTNPTGDDMTTPAPAVRTDESLDQIWALFEEADRLRWEAAEKAKAFEAEAVTHKEAAIRLREQAAELLRQAEQADASEQTALRHAASLRATEGRQEAIAADHADDVERKVALSGREHPRVRRERAAQQQAASDALLGSLPSGTPAQGTPVAGENGQRPVGDVNSAFAPPPAPQGPAS
jgi:membrane protein involved in colicin uptake